jgi:hypothetical protein
MKTTLQLLALSLLLAACSTVPSDARIQQKLIGSWKMGRGTTTFESDGSWIHKFTVNVTDKGFQDLTNEGTWQVKGGILDVTMTKTSWPNPELGVEHLKIVHVDDHELVFYPGDKTNSVTSTRE